jgi:hypothetical protein
VTRDRCYDFKNNFANFLAENIYILTQSKAADLCKIFIITLVFEKKKTIFLPKIVKNRDHNVDPRRIVKKLPILY